MLSLTVDSFRQFLCLVCLLLLPASQVLAELAYSDPLSPADQDDEFSLPAEVPFYQIGQRIHQIEAEMAQAQADLQQLAPLQPAKQLDEFGYHSDYIPAVSGVPEQPLWTIDIDRAISNRRILGFVMVPAIDERAQDLKAYAFPKRFRIVSINSKGVPGEVYVDWTEEDFPDPGMRPVVFKFPSQYALDAATISRKGLRLEVFAGLEENGLEYFSLARVHLIRTAEVQWPRKVEVSSSFESAPYWGADYLASSRHTLGMPLTGQAEGRGDLTVPMPLSKLPQPLVIRIQLDDVDAFGWVNFFPGQSPDGIGVPGYGFPRELRLYRVVKRAHQPGFRRFAVQDQVLPKNPGSNMLRLTDAGRSLVALEIECNDFPEYQGQAVFAMGEIELFMRGRNLSLGRPVSVSGLEFDSDYDWGLLVDGRVNGRKTLALIEWIEQLAAAKPHEARLAFLQAEHERLTARWQQLSRHLWLAFGLLSFLGLLAFVGLMRYSRRLAQQRLRRQVNSDLHDDVGSSLGSISLIVEQLQHADLNEEVREDLHDLSLMTREAWASLREVVWGIDQDSIRLPVLIQKLTERAQRVLAGAEIFVVTPPDCPNSGVSLTFKRHILMYFKEVVHNCARHAQATQVDLKFEIVGSALRISVRDNGVGFDVEQNTNGIGLASLHNRAHEMGAVFVLNSQLGVGTSVELTVPLKSLLNRTDHSYKTSN